jgi:hypothetical protein
MEDPVPHQDTPQPILQPIRTGMPILIGAVGGLLFLFAFPKGSITTLMHDVLHLPGPGAGIALILGPVALIFIFLSSRLTQGALGGALLTSLAFAVTYTLASRILMLPTSEKGLFGSAWFVAALVMSGVVAEMLLLLSRHLRPTWRLLLTACGANSFLLLFYWLAIFPRTKGWVSWEDVPALFALSLAGGITVGLASRAIGNWIPHHTGSIPRRQTDVWTR